MLLGYLYGCVCCHLLGCAIRRGGLLVAACLGRRAAFAGCLLIAFSGLVCCGWGLCGYIVAFSGCRLWFTGAG